MWEYGKRKSREGWEGCKCGFCGFVNVWVYLWSLWADISAAHGIPHSTLSSPWLPMWVVIGHPLGSKYPPLQSCMYGYITLGAGEWVLVPCVLTWGKWVEGVSFGLLFASNVRFCWSNCGLRGPTGALLYDSAHSSPRCAYFSHRIGWNRWVMGLGLGLALEPLGLCGNKACSKVLTVRLESSYCLSQYPGDPKRFSHRRS